MFTNRDGLQPSFLGKILKRLSRLKAVYLHKLSVYMNIEAWKELHVK
jgi:hypothetical protein